MADVCEHSIREKSKKTRDGQNESEVSEMQVEQIKEMLVDAEKLLNVLNDLKNMELSNTTFVPTSLEDKLLKIKECAKRMQTSEITVREYIRSGKLPALKIGDLKVRESTLVKFMAEQEAEYMQNEEFKKIG